MLFYIDRWLPGRRPQTKGTIHPHSPLHFELLEDRRVLSTSAPTDTFIDPSPVLDGPAGSSISLPANDVATSAKDVKRYAIVGDNLGTAEATLAKLEVTKIKAFKHFSGIAVKLTESEAETLRATVGTDTRVVMDEPFQAIVDAEVLKGKPGNKPGGGGGNQGQQVPWGINAVNAIDAWSVTRGAGIAVCVTDTGLDADHPDLLANIGPGANYIDGGSWDDDNGHGTHVGGTIAALDNTIGVVGVAPEATLLGAKWINRRGRGTNTDAAEAIYGCLDLRDQVDPDMPLVVNMSWQIGGSAEQREIVHAAIRDLTAQGVVFVGAVGNSNAGMVTPGRWPEVLVVTGVDEDLNFASFSGWNTGLLPPPEYRDPDFTAPAVDVLSTWKGGRTRKLDGTSMATPHVSGVVALGLAAGTLEPLIRDSELYPNVPPLLAPLARDIGLPLEKQGMGLVDALLTVQNQPSQAASIQALQLSDLSAKGEAIIVRTSTPFEEALSATEAGATIDIASPASALLAELALLAVDSVVADSSSPEFANEEIGATFGLGGLFLASDEEELDGA